MKKIKNTYYWTKVFKTNYNYLVKKLSNNSIYKNVKIAVFSWFFCRATLMILNIVEKLTLNNNKKIMHENLYNGRSKIYWTDWQLHAHLISGHIQIKRYCKFCPFNVICYNFKFSDIFCWEWNCNCIIKI